MPNTKNFVAVVNRGEKTETYVLSGDTTLDALFARLKDDEGPIHTSRSVTLHEDRASKPTFMEIVDNISAGRDRDDVTERSRER